MNLVKRVALVLWGTGCLFSTAIAESTLEQSDDLIFGISDLTCDSVIESLSEKLVTENRPFARDLESHTIFVEPKEVTNIGDSELYVVRDSHVFSLDCAVDGFVEVTVRTVVEQRELTGSWGKLSNPSVTKATRQSVLPDYIQNLVLESSQ